MAFIESSVDVECYRDYFLVKIKDFDSGRYQEFEMYPGKQLDYAGLRMALAIRTSYGFNIIGYDMCIIAAALAGASNETLKQYNDAIIVGRMKWWEFYRQFDIPQLNYDVVDLSEVAPGVRISLKMYACRMHSSTVQDLPIDPAASVAPQQRPLMRQYCGNDLDVTHDMREKLRERLQLRESIGQRYGIDVRSKSDAQIAEAVIKAQIKHKPQKRRVPHGFQFYYQPPKWIKFNTYQLQDLLRLICTTAFTVNDTDQIKRAPGEKIFDLDGKEVKTGLVLPQEIQGTDIVIGSSTYRIGIGGLHSQESGRAILQKAGFVLTDHDVASYYPTLILLAGLFPEAIGREFLAIYRRIYDERLEAKRMAQQCEANGQLSDVEHWQTIADSLKITLNGAFGKLGSKHSILFAPELLIQTTITGQLAILMLIEDLETRGIEVLSANTDGIVVRTPHNMLHVRDNIIMDWEYRTGLQTEATEYVAMFNRSVNDYVAFTKKGKIKRKGSTFAKPGLLENKHPDREICADAVVEYLANGTPVEDTVRACTDIRKFLRVRQVDGGGVWSKTGEYLGKAVRWYWAQDRNSHIYSTKTNNMVASSTGSVPLMTLIDYKPDDLDHDYYINECYNILYEIGVHYHRRVEHVEVE